MTAGLRQRTASRKNTWSLNHVGAGGFGQIPIATASIAHGGKASHQHALHDGQGAQGGKYVGLVGGDVEVQVRRNDVHVAIDQARHQSFALGLHHFGAVGNEHVGLVRYHRFDQSVFDPNILVFLKLQRLNV